MPADADRGRKGTAATPAAALEQDVSAWVGAMGTVPSGRQYLKVTVQGTGKATVVVDGLTARMAGKRAPLAWNDYAMDHPGVGCGGNVPPRSFTVALDAARPDLVPEAKHDDSPFSVSESAPEVCCIRAGRRLRVRHQLVPGAELVQRRPERHPAGERRGPALPYERQQRASGVRVPAGRRQVGRGRDHRLVSETRVPARSCRRCGR
ncbi:hypothetical protein GCM10010320_09530 [Streptomyces caelestis]|nr:hypothetical protein GCM10010320_09530 [Streptomyces caelestis]